VQRLQLALQQLGLVTGRAQLCAVKP
jgi:hypothetical protein